MRGPVPTPSMPHAVLLGRGATRSTALLLPRQHLPDLRPLDERVEEDDEGLLLLVGESVDSAVELVELGVSDLEVRLVGLGASDELVEADFEEVGELDESGQAGEGGSV